MALAPIFAQWLPFVKEAATRHRVGVAVIYAVMSRETGGRNIVGDGGHGRGLMQIDDRSHAAFLAANDGGMNPRTNIDKGAEILRACMNAFPGDLKAALCAYNAGVGRVREALNRGEDPDTVTTGKDYGSDVIRRTFTFAGAAQEQVPPSPPGTTPGAPPTVGGGSAVGPLVAAAALVGIIAFVATKGGR